MTTLAEFTPYYLRSVWREGDAALTQDLPRLVKEAEARISRDIRDARIMGVFDLAVVSPDTSAPLPADFREIADVSFAGGVQARAVPFSQLQDVRARRLWHGASVFHYSIYNDAVHVLLGDNLAVAARISYYAGLAPFDKVKDGQQSFYDMHPDFFLSALNAQVQNYLRDFELAAAFETKYAALLEDMRRESYYIAYPSGQLPSPFGAVV